MHSEGMTPFVINLDAKAGYKPLLTGKPQTAGMKSGLVSVGPGESCGEHTTASHEEALVVLEGTGRLVLAGKNYLEISGGQVAYVPPNTFHDVRNMGGTPLKYVYIVAPVTKAKESNNSNERNDRK